MKNFPYQTFKHRVVCENRYLSVSMDTIGKNGKIMVENYMSISPKTCNKEKITGVVTLPVKNGKYGLLQMYRHPIEDYSWELPGGFMETNESPALSALRELQEEAGLICSEKDLINLGSFYPAPGLLSGKVCIFSAEKCMSAPKKAKDEFGISQFKWFSKREIEELIINGSISDMATVLAINIRIKSFNASS
jgi:ADP-ribose pyrophosphatase